jgi:hypothetical protein
MAKTVVAVFRKDCVELLRSFINNFGCKRVRVTTIFKFTRLLNGD